MRPCGGARGPCARPASRHHPAWMGSRGPGIGMRSFSPPEPPGWEWTQTVKWGEREREGQQFNKRPGLGIRFRFVGSVNFLPNGSGDFFTNWILVRLFWMDPECLLPKTSDKIDIFSRKFLYFWWYNQINRNILQIKLLSNIFNLINKLVFSVLSTREWQLIVRTRPRLQGCGSGYLSGSTSWAWKTLTWIDIIRILDSAYRFGWIQIMTNHSYLYLSILSIHINR